MAEQIGKPNIKLSVRDGGWVLIVAAILTVAVPVRMLYMVFSKDRPKPMGDGQNVDSYGFDLKHCKIPKERLTASGMPKDGLIALVAPDFITPDDADAITRKKRGKFLVPHDRIIGVNLKGEAKAYPLRILNWHEVVNDELGDQSILVTYNPLCDSVAVFNRKIGGKEHQFGVSGLLFNSNLLMYDKREKKEDESLWSQLQFRAIAGPAAQANRQLELIPATLCTWSEWRHRHPHTKVLAPDPNKEKQYKRDPYISYFGSDRIRFPVDPLPPEGGLALKDRIVAVRKNESWHVFSLKALAHDTDPSGICSAFVEGERICFMPSDRFGTAIVESADHGVVEAVYGFWFAWHAMHPDRPPDPTGI